jgi:hypothetical protein
MNSIGTRRATLWTLRKSLRDSRKRPQLLLQPPRSKIGKSVTHAPGLNCYLSSRSLTISYQPGTDGEHHCKAFRRVSGAETSRSGVPASGI